jgi:hypothetical protein
LLSYVAETTLLKIRELVKYSSKSASLSNRYGWGKLDFALRLLAAVRIPFAILLERHTHAAGAFLDAEAIALAKSGSESTNQPELRGKREAQ